MKVFDLKRFRRDKNLTQKDLAAIFGCNQNFVSRMESGERPIPAEKMEVLKAQYGDMTAYYTEQDVLQRPEKTVTVTQQSLDFIAAGGEAFSTQLVRMMNKKQIAPYQWLEDRDKTIAELNREIGRLEARLEEVKKEVAPVAASVGCATAG